MLELITYSRQRYEPELGRPANCWFLMLPGAGCSWAKSSGGCYMCGFKQATERYSRGRVLPPLLHKALWKLWKFASEGQGPEVFYVFNGGSFLNEREIPERFQDWFFARTGEVEGLQRVLVETRPEFVTTERVKRAVEACGPVKLTLAIGLECYSDEVRDASVHKGFKRSDFERAVEIISDCGALLHTYVLLKPILLGEREAVAQATRTVQYAFAQGSHTVSLECAFVQPGTNMAALFNQGLYKPPWLWSIAEVVKNCTHMGTLYVGNFEDEPPPIATPANCDFCSASFTQELYRYNVTQRISDINTFFCGCFEEWWSEYRTPAPAGGPAGLAAVLRGEPPLPT